MNPLKWHGGKSPLASWIHSLSPKHYTHRNIACAGGLGEFWNWLPVEGISEAVNDANEELINFYRVLQTREDRLLFLERVTMMPLSEQEFEATMLRVTSDPVDKAINFFVRYRMSRQGLGQDYMTPTNRIRRAMNENVSAWLSTIEGLADCVERLIRVELRCMDVLDFIRAYDHANALFYIDPPYFPNTRSAGGEYGRYEMDEFSHACLLGMLSNNLDWKVDYTPRKLITLRTYTFKGKFMLSGYRCPLYDRVAEASGWHRHDHDVANHASSSTTKERRIESIWCNYF